MKIVIYRGFRCEVHNRATHLTADADGSVWESNYRPHIATGDVCTWAADPTTGGHWMSPVFSADSKKQVYVGFEKPNEWRGSCQLVSELQEVTA